jgi:hypothetical protein
MSQPAFPSEHMANEQRSGMTLRDYFAAKAFQVRLAKYDDWTLTELSYQAYLDADALLEARSA